MSLTPPRKQPVQPWIPQRPTAGPAAVVHVVHHHQADRPSADGPLRSGWIFTLICGALLGLGAGLGLATEQGRGSVAQGIAGMAGLIFFGMGYYLAIFAELVILIMAIIAMARGAAGRGIALLLGAPLVLLLMAAAGGLTGYGVSHGLVVIEQTAEAPRVADAAEPEREAPADPVQSALRMEGILTEARKMLAVRDEGTYQLARNASYAQAANDPDLTAEHREAVRRALDTMYREADFKRKRL